MKDKIVKKVEHLPQLTDVKRTDKLIQRVAAYARVSTEKEEQQTSIEAQKDYYSTYIKTHVGWEFVGVYADEGISGCSTKRRVQFNQLMNDCRDGKIDMVLTKSISRFGRNTVDTLNAIRELKSNGIGVYFEKEQIWTLDSKGELSRLCPPWHRKSHALCLKISCGQCGKDMHRAKAALPIREFSVLIEVRRNSRLL